MLSGEGENPPPISDPHGWTISLNHGRGVYSHSESDREPVLYSTEAIDSTRLGR